MLNINYSAPESSANGYKQEKMQYIKLQTINKRTYKSLVKRSQISPNINPLNTSL